MKNDELNALIHLLEDPDDTIYQQIKGRLVEIGEEAIPALERFWEDNSFGLYFQSRIEEVIHVIQFDLIVQELKKWADDGGVDLLEGALLVNKYQYPDLNESQIKTKLNQIKQDIWLELNDNLTSFEKVRIINHILYDVHGFSGNKKNFHAPQNSYLNNVIESKKGNPLTLSIIYLHLAESLNIPVKGINLPNHFVIGYLDENSIRSIVDENEESDPILFYINTFSRGIILDKKEIIAFLEQINQKPLEEYIYPTSNIEIIKRIISNLINSYLKLGYPDKVEELKELLEVLN